MIVRKPTPIEAIIITVILSIIVLVFVADYPDKEIAYSDNNVTYRVDTVGFQVMVPLIYEITIDTIEIDPWHWGGPVGCGGYRVNFTPVLPTSPSLIDIQYHTKNTLQYGGTR